MCALEIESAEWLGRHTDWPARRAEVDRTLGDKVRGIAYPHVAGVQLVHLPALPPQTISIRPQLSPGLMDPILEEARVLNVYDDYKLLSDAHPAEKPAPEVAGVFARARSLGNFAPALDPISPNGRVPFLRAVIDGLYDFGCQLRPASGLADVRWRLDSGDPALDRAFAYTEQSLAGLVQWTADTNFGSLLPAPYPVLIPAAGRFHEAYYWDSYFGVKWLLRTRRMELARMQAENLLELVRRFGFIPNGTRDYYLSRSQPPFLSSIVRAIVENAPEDPAVREWLRRRAYPLVKLDYEHFWMNPLTRYDLETGLNHHWDALLMSRQERHGRDDDRTLGRTFRDTRAEAESGEDFTDALDGEASNVAGVLLNAMMFRTERDLAWFAGLVGNEADRVRYLAAAEARRGNMARLWNESKGRFENYNLRTGRRVDMLTVDNVVPLFVGLVSSEKARRIRDAVMVLERAGGLMTTEVHNERKQWTGRNVFAAHVHMAIVGLQRYGYHEDAARLARKWVNMLVRTHEATGGMFERYDVELVGVPREDEHKYPTQRGFLWTNAQFVLTLDTLGYRFQSFR